jgi:hypothetical protein
MYLVEVGQYYGAFFHYPSLSWYVIVPQRNMLGWTGFFAIDIETDYTYKSQQDT